MPHALLLSPDDQAVTAITDVLEEMSVTCERPLDGASAAQKLNSHSFDLVLVDCENLPAAKLIFDVCRRGKSGNNPVPIAIVDGRAGLPTAFRLGAELILTKPVAKDQARNTIRTAVSRVRKDVPANESVPVQPANPAMPGVVMTTAAMPEERARAAAVSSQLTSFADPVPAAVPIVASTKILSAPTVTTTMHSAVDEIAAPPATPKLNPRSAPVLASSLPEVSPARAVLEDSKPARLPSDDPVLAELEESELKESELKSKEPGKVATDKTAAGSAAPVFASYQQNQQKKRSPLVALLMLGVAAGGGLYAAWTYQPGFREIAQPQIDRVLALAGIANSPKNLPAAPNRVKPSTQPAAQPPAATSSSPAPESPTDPNQTQSSIPDSTAGPSATSDAAAFVQPAAAPGTTVAKANSGAKAATAPPASKADVSKPNDSKKDAAAAPLSATQLPGEDSAIILSSKGAEKRLAHSIQPKFPAEARSSTAQGTVVLKEVVDENGKVEGVRLVEGDAALATAAIQAVKQWRYRPYVRNGKAQPFQTVVIIDFQRP
ncbi:MAG: TonB family protein [Terriglobales bacterium]